MDAGENSETTRLLRSWAAGDKTALDQLTPSVYQELKRIARHFMKQEQPGRTLQTTALIHEAYLKLIDVTNVNWQDRAHFFAIAAQIMRRILLERARRRVAAKRGGAGRRLNLDEALDVSASPAAEIVALDDALTNLAKQDPRKAQVIELRFYGGLSVLETSEVLKISEASVLRDWRMARAWLLKELSDPQPFLK